MLVRRVNRNPPPDPNESSDSAETSTRGRDTNAATPTPVSPEDQRRNPGTVEAARGLALGEDATRKLVASDCAGRVSVGVTVMLQELRTPVAVEREYTLPHQHGQLLLWFVAERIYFSGDLLLTAADFDSVRPRRDQKRWWPLCGVCSSWSLISLPRDVLIRIDEVHTFTLELWELNGIVAKHRPSIVTIHFGELMITLIFCVFVKFNTYV